MNSSQEFATRRCSKDITLKQMCNSCGDTTEDGMASALNMLTDMHIYKHVSAQYKKQPMSSTSEISDKFPVASMERQYTF